MTNDENEILNIVSNISKDAHKGQEDKGGNDYFQGHIKYVVSRCKTLEECIVGYFHDICEDTPYDEDTLLSLFKNKIDCNGIDLDIIKEALILLNQKYSINRKEYIKKIIDSKNQLAIQVKIYDLESNMNLSRILNLSKNDYIREKRYLKEYFLLRGLVI